MALAPAGEFGFVLVALAQRDALLSEKAFQVVLSAALLSMLAAPLILARMESIVLYFVESEWTQRALALHTLAVKSMASQGHVIVCGYGRSGQALAQFLERERIPVIALDADPERVRQAAAAGDSVVYGDASRREVLVAAALSRADRGRGELRRHAQGARHPRARARDAPELPVIVRTFDDSDVGRLKEAGAAEIVGRGGRGLAHARDADDDAARRPAEPRAAAPAGRARGALSLDGRLLPRGHRRGALATPTSHG
jgi:CPA2 family monovalent cation:H+ antiporter-2